MKTIEQLLEDLAKNGGAIVCSASCHENEIAQARACDHFAVRDDGIGFVHRSNEWLALVDSKVTDDPEDRALDALIVAAMRGIDPEEIKKAVSPPDRSLPDMKMVEIWMCEAAFSCDEYAKFASRKRDAEKLQANAFGYGRIQDCVKDGWAKRAVKISVPAPVAEVLLG